MDTQNTNVNMIRGNGRDKRKGKDNDKGVESSTRGGGRGRSAFSRCPPPFSGFENWNSIGVSDGRNFIPSNMVILS